MNENRPILASNALIQKLVAVTSPIQLTLFQSAHLPWLLPYHTHGPLLSSCHILDLPLLS